MLPFALGTAEFGARTAVKRTDFEVAEIVTLARHVGIVTVFRDGRAENGRCGLVQRRRDMHQSSVSSNHAVSMLQDGCRLVKRVFAAAVGGALAELRNHTLAFFVHILAAQQHDGLVQYAGDFHHFGNGYALGEMLRR